MDKQLARIMPDSWEGHARLLIRNSDIVTESVEEKAISKVTTIAEKKGVSPKRAAKMVINAIEDKQSKQ